MSNAKFVAAGLNPITVEVGLMEEVVDITKKYSDRCDRSKVLPSAFWTKSRATAAAADTSRTEDKSV